MNQILAMIAEMENLVAVDEPEQIENLVSADESYPNHSLQNWKT